MIRFGLPLMEGAGRSQCFLHGHKDYYQRFGYSAELAADFGGPWSGPHFMASRLIETGPSGGTLKYPAAFGT